MGGKSSTTKQSSLSLPKFHYLDRISLSIISFDNITPQISKISNEITLFKNSAILNSDDMFFVLGGNSDSGSLQKDFFSVDSSTLNVKRLENVPIPTKLGYLFCYKRSIIYSGGVSRDPITGKKIQSPIMRYSLLKDTWEIFNHHNLILPKSNNTRHKNLRKPGYLVIKSKLIMFGGYFRTSTRRVPNKTVISFDLKSENLNFYAENFHFPTDIYSPVTSSTKNKGLVAGGKTTNSVLNDLVYKFVDSKFQVVKNLKIKVAENYPPIIRSDFEIIFSYPDVSVRPCDSTEWKSFSFDSEVQSFKTLQKSSSENIIRQSENLYKTRSLGSLSQRNDLSSQLSPRSQGVFSFDQSLDNLDLDFILDLESDREVKVFHKAALKLLVFISDKIEKKKLDAIDVNGISAQLNFEPEISVSQVVGVLECLMSKENYSVQEVITVYRAVHRILKCNKIRSMVLLKILKGVGVEKFGNSLSKENLIYVLGRLVKAGVVGVEI